MDKKAERFKETILAQLNEIGATNITFDVIYNIVNDKLLEVCYYWADLFKTDYYVLEKHSED